VFIGTIRFLNGFAFSNQKKVTVKAHIEPFKIENFSPSHPGMKRNGNNSLNEIVAIELSNKVASS
jgi:hypothetical protein